MTDYAAEQEMEMEALEAILMELDEPPSESWPETASTSYRIEIRTDEEIAEGSYEKKLDLVFAHTPSYPDEPPLWRLSNIQGLTEQERRDVNELLEQQIQENLGMAMIYTIVTVLKEWLVEQMAGSSRETKFELSEEEKEKRRKEAEEQKLAELRAHGIPVTTDTFAEWKRKFDTEKRLEKAKLEPQSIDKDKGPTGKQFFLSEDAAKQVAEEQEGESEGSDFDDEDEDLYDDDDEEDDEDELLDQILAQKGRA